MSERRDYSDVVSEVADQTAPTSAEIRQLRLRMEPEKRTSRARSRPWWELPALMTVATACVLALIVLASPWLLSHRLDDEASWELASTRPTELAVGSLVSLVHNGTGWVEGSVDNVAIVWEAGVLDIAVVPDRDVVVNIETPEAYVRVVGTQLQVSRVDVNTRVTVAQGSVSIRCLHHDGGSDPAVEVAADGQHHCATTDADAVLMQAVLLRGEGANAQRILALITHGLTLAEDGPVHFELVAASVAPLLDLGQRDEALAAIDRYLAAGDLPRSQRFRDLAEKIRAGGSLEE